MRRSGAKASGSFSAGRGLVQGLRRHGAQRHRHRRLRDHALQVFDRELRERIRAERDFRARGPQKKDFTWFFHDAADYRKKEPHGPYPVRTVRQLII